MSTRALWNLAGARAPLRALAVWAVLAQPAALAQPDLAPLFAPRAGTPKAAAVDAADESTVRTDRRMVRANRDVLRAVREQVSSVGAGKLRLNLFDDIDFEATLERSTPTASGYTLSGPLDGVPFGRVVLVVNDGVTMGRVYTPEGNYSIRGTSSVQTIERMPASPLRCATLHPEGDELARGDLKPHGSHADAKGVRRQYGAGSDVGAPAITARVLRAPSVTAPTRGLNHAAGMAGSSDGSVPRTKASPAAAESDADDGDVVDVLVVYPSFVRGIEGGYGLMLSLIDLDIATANEAYAASGVELRVELGAAVELEYDWFQESRYRNDIAGIELWGAALEHLSGKDDGFLDEVHALRDRHSADLVLLHLGGETHGAIDRFLLGGVAWGIDDVTRDALEALAFSVARSGDGTFVAHELGHSMGLAHDRSEGSTNKPFPYSHGFRYWHPGARERGLGPYGTIMSQASGVGGDEFVLAFSNPDLIHPDYDIPLGVPGDQPSSEVDGPADATRHLNELRGVLANVRSLADGESCRYEVVGDDGKLPAAGGTFRLRVETESGCRWAAKGGEWVSSVVDKKGTGSGEIRYTVGRNDGFQRRVEMLVAGQVLTRKQAGSRPVTPVCQRSSSIVDDLVESHPDYRVEATTAGNVVIVTYETPCHELNFDADYLASVPGLGDFEDSFVDGLDMSELQPGDFDGLTGVTQLRLHSGVRMPPDLLFGMTGLRVLKIWVEDSWEPEPATLAEIAPGAFRGLSGVRLLEIGPHRLERLEADTFEGLSGLEYLVILHPQGPALTLEPGTFQGLSSLVRLGLSGNHIKSLEPGTFNGTPELIVLYLNRNRLSSLPVGLFDGLSRLEDLELADNRISDLQPGVFKDLTRLKELQLRRNGLTTLHPESFAGLSELKSLDLQHNRLRNLTPGVFEDLASLEDLYLRRNRLGTLRTGVFAGLDKLRRLYLNDVEVASLEPGAFDGASRLEVVDLDKNRLRELVPGALAGADLWGLHLTRSPGAPFAFSPTPVSLLSADAARGSPVEFAVEVVPEAPFGTKVELSATGGSLSIREFWIGAGEDRSDPVTVTPDSDGPVTVRVDRVRWRGVGAEEPDEVEDDGTGPLVITIDFRYGFSGFDVAPGPPLVLYGFPDTDLTRGRGAATVDLTSVFSYFLGPDPNYDVSSDNEAVVAASADNGTLTLSPNDAGTAEVTVTATGPDGETMTRRFTVTVSAPSIPLFLADGHASREGFARVVNRSGKAGTVRVTAVDDSGTRHGPVGLRLRPHGAAQFNSTDLEEGSEVKRLPEGVGAGVGEGNWRLEFESDLDIEALSYVRTGDGFLTPIHDAAPLEDGVYRIATFNPAGNARQASRLRVVNPGRRPAEVEVRGIDDAGSSPGGAAQFTVMPGAAREFSAAQLEVGDASLEGALGDGEGKWRLTVESDTPVVAMSLLENVSTGHLTNLSAGPVRPDGDGAHHVPLFPSASDARGRQGFARVINRSQRDGTVGIRAFDDTGARYGPLELSIGAGEAAHFNSDDLELGAADKGLSGSTGSGDGDWRLEMTSDLDVEVLAYVRTEDGFLTTVHDTVALRDGRRDVVTFNPGGNTNQVSLLRLVNPTSRDVEVSVVGTDDTGTAPPHRGATWVTVPAGGALRLDASELEAGVLSEYYAGLLARGLEVDESWWGYWDRWPLGDGAGKWQLSVVAEPGVLVQSLLESPTGHLTNLSSDGR